MQSVTARAYSGYCVVLDQCLRCGGIWCDRWELFPVTAEEAERLDAIDEKKVVADVPAPQTPGRCPRCGIDLKPFHDPLLPPDARIERCRVCEGMWLNRGELIRFKRRAPHRPRVADESLDALAEAYGTTAKWTTVRELDGAVRPGRRAPRSGRDDAIGSVGDGTVHRLATAPAPRARRVTGARFRASGAVAWLV